jgi:hypothetical protein
MKKCMLYLFATVLLFSSCKNDKKSAEAEDTGNTAVVYYNGDIITMEGKEATYADAVVV